MENERRNVGADSCPPCPYDSAQFQFRVRAHSRAPLQFLLILLVFAGCVTQQVVENTTYDYSKIKRISVVTFDGPGGAAVTDEVVKALLATGIEVTDAHHPGDAILRGTVSEYKSANQLSVFLGNTTLLTAGGQTITVDDPVVSLAESQAAPQETTPSAHHPQIASLIASAGVFVNLIDSSSKKILWGGSFAYDSLSMPEAVHAIADMMTASMAKALPRMKK
jgi:hypothetical protein